MFCLSRLIKNLKEFALLGEPVNSMFKDNGTSRTIKPKKYD
jgi:hypothetical protein